MSKHHFRQTSGGHAAAGALTGPDLTDQGPERVTRAGVQVQSSSRSLLSMDQDGCFLDPEKYEAVKLLGTGGFAKVGLLIQGNGTKGHNGAQHQS